MTDPRTSPPPSRLPAPAKTEHTHWSMGLVGFYLSCAGVALGATFAGGGYFFFGSTGWLVFGACMSAICSVTTFLTLRAARRPPATRR